MFPKWRAIGIPHHNISRKPPTYNPKTLIKSQYETQSFESWIEFLSYLNIMKQKPHNKFLEFTSVSHFVCTENIDSINSNWQLHGFWHKRVLKTMINLPPPDNFSELHVSNLCVYFELMKKIIKHCKDMSKRTKQFKPIPKPRIPSAAA